MTDCQAQFLTTFYSSALHFYPGSTVTRNKSSLDPGHPRSKAAGLMSRPRFLLFLSCAHRFSSQSPLLSSCRSIISAASVYPGHSRLLRPHNTSRNLHMPTSANMVSPGSEIVAHSGRRYVVERVVQKKENSSLGVYVAKYTPYTPFPIRCVAGFTKYLLP